MLRHTYPYFPGTPTIWKAAQTFSGAGIAFTTLSASALNAISLQVAGTEQFKLHHEADRDDYLWYAANGTLNVMRYMDVPPASFGRPTTYGRVLFQTDLIVYNTQGSEAVYGNDEDGAYMFEGRVGAENTIYNPVSEGRWAVFSTTAAYGPDASGVKRVVVETENNYHMDLAAGSNDTPGFARTALRVRNGSASADNVAQGARGVDLFEFIEFQNSELPISVPHIRSDDGTGLQIGGDEPIGFGIAQRDRTGVLIGRTFTVSSGAAQMVAIANGTMTLAPNTDGSALDVSGVIEEAASGTHPIVAGLRVRALSLTDDAGAATTLAASVYVDGAPTVGSSLYSVYVAAGQTRLNQSGIAAAIPVLRLDQADVSEEFIRFVGSAAAATLTQSIVAEADVTTATRQGFLKVFVQDDGNQITDQAYFIPIFTLA